MVRIVVHGISPGLEDREIQSLLGQVKDSDWYCAPAIYSFTGDVATRRRLYANLEPQAISALAAAVPKLGTKDKGCSLELACLQKLTCTAQAQTTQAKPSKKKIDWKDENFTRFVRTGTLDFSGPSQNSKKGSQSQQKKSNTESKNQSPQAEKQSTPAKNPRSKGSTPQESGESTSVSRKAHVNASVNGETSKKEDSKAKSKKNADLKKKRAKLGAQPKSGELT